MQKKTDILFIAPFPPPYAGPEISAELFINSNIGKHFTIKTLNTSIRKNNAEKGRLNITMIRSFFNLIIRLLNNLVRYKPSIVYYYVTATILGWICKDIWVIIISKLFGAKVVIHMRAGHFRTNYNRSFYVFRRTIKWVIGKTDLALCQSKSLEPQFKNLINSNKIKSIHNMIQLSRYHNKNFKDYDRNIILFVGHLSHAKGYCDVLLAIPKVVKHFPKIKFYFAGTKLKNEKNVFYNEITKEKISFTDPDDVYNNVIKNKYEKNYKYLGNIDQDQKITMLRKANLFILPSYSEGFSMSILESMASSKPIITTEVGASKDIIQNNYNGLIIPPGDVEEIEKSIIYLLQNTHVRDQISENNSVDRNNYSTSNIVKQYARIFKGLI